MSNPLFHGWSRFLFHGYFMVKSQFLGFHPDFSWFNPMISSLDGTTLTDFTKTPHLDRNGNLPGLENDTIPQVVYKIRWLIYGYYMADIWLLYGWYMVTIWLIYGYYMADIWLLYGWYMVTIWLIYGYYMADIWLLYGWYMVIIWLIIIILAGSSHLASGL